MPPSPAPTAAPTAAAENSEEASAAGTAAAAQVAVGAVAQVAAWVWTAVVTASHRWAAVTVGVVGAAAILCGCSSSSRWHWLRLSLSSWVARKREPPRRKNHSQPGQPHTSSSLSSTHRSTTRDDLHADFHADFHAHDPANARAVDADVHADPVHAGVDAANDISRASCPERVTDSTRAPDVLPGARSTLCAASDGPCCHDAAAAGIRSCDAGSNTFRQLLASAHFFFFLLHH